ncbi:MAG TPA: ABC transporter permease [Vicinamibacterales bacterium]|jgi:putative ABC transport system permease protein|nr:ABC transporter permease [Vicinamibacterales bacterium]
MAKIRTGLMSEIVIMSWDTLRGNKMRSALTVLGVVIGITSIVGMTSLIRGFDQSLRDSIKALGPNTILVQKFSGLTILSGKSFLDVIRRPNITIEDSRAIAEQCPSVALVDVWLGLYGGNSRWRMFYGHEKTKQLLIMGATDNFAEVNFANMELGRTFLSAEVDHRNAVVILGQTPYQSLFANTDPIGKKVRIGPNEFTVIGVMGPRPNLGGLNSGADDLAVIPYTTHEKFFGSVQKGSAKVSGSGITPSMFRTAMIAIVPQENSREKAMAEVETVMRIRHNLKLDQPDDFDLATQDAALKVWDQFSSATFLALVVISSIALMVGGIGVMAIMMISVTERTREIGVRKALGARRREILWQFLIEAAFLTSAGGLLGIALGSGIGVGVHLLSGFPISLPWWSFAIGIGFSASIGIVFGMFPAFKAARLDPIEALRYE